ncbi:MAG: DUF3592 domain-containing protein [Tissierellia bacterium]|nr:DUF3592 domain-containing protein [Tissierellia bacterium]
MGRRSALKGERCSARTVGVVLGPSLWSYEDSWIPLVEYVVDGRAYRVAGPKDSFHVSRSVGRAFSGGDGSGGSVQERLSFDPAAGSFSWGKGDSLLKRYPVGSEVEVFYNPRHPQESYVISLVPPPRWIGIALYGASGFFVFLSVLLLVLALFLG